MKSKYKKYRNLNDLGQLGNQHTKTFDPPPAEYMTQLPDNMHFRRPKPKEVEDTGLDRLGNAEKDERRQAWLKKKQAKKRGLRQLTMGG
jgi:hypothetical protein